MGGEGEIRSVAERVKTGGKKMRSWKIRRRVEERGEEEKGSKVGVRKRKEKE